MCDQTSNRASAATQRHVTCMVKDTLRADEEDEDDDSCGVSKELTFEPGQALTVELMYQTFTADINAGFKGM